MKDRLLAGGGTLFAAAAAFPVMGRRGIELWSHEPAHPKRTAVVELRHGAVEICRPQDERDHSLPLTLRLRLVDVREVTTEGGGTSALAAADHAYDRGRRGSIGNCRMVSASLGHRTAVPGDEIAGTAVGRQPTRLGGTAGEARRGGDESGLRGHPVDPGPRRHRSHAGVQCIHRIGDRHSCGTRPNARRPHRAKAKSPSHAKSRPRFREGRLWAAWIIARLGGWNCYDKPPGSITFRRGREQFHAIRRGREIEIR